MSILSKILETKKEEVVALLARESFESLKQKAENAEPARGFYLVIKEKVEAGLPSVIAEIKKASPSKGLIRADFDPASIAASYAENGAACLSVLTDHQYFQGANEYLVAAKRACDLPVLRKDFIIDVAQIYEARTMGADAILLIAAALTQDQLVEFEAVARGLGMDVLVEVHDEDELGKALNLKTPLIGVNNRNLKTFEVDLKQTLKLLPMLPDDRLLICESGIESADDMATMMANGVYGFLIGETFMRARDPGVFLAACLSRLKNN